MAELKKCPFCGGEAELNYYGSESMPFYSVSCKECGCNQETIIHKEAVINAWNNRATEADIRAKAIDEFAEKLKHEFAENIFSDEEKFRYDRRTQEAICAQNATWKVALQYVQKFAEQLKEE